VHDAAGVSSEPSILEAGVRGRIRRTFGPGLIAGVVWSSAVAAQAAPAKGGSASDPCALATDAEFQKAQGINPAIGIIPSTPEPTKVVWGQHCDYSTGAIDLFTEKSPAAELDRVLGLMKATKRDPVQGLGQKAFFTVIYPGDQYRQRGFIAVFLGPKIVGVSLDPGGKDSPEATRPKVEALAKTVLSRVK
jgi:hypothetical protein